MMAQAGALLITLMPGVPSPADPSTLLHLPCPSPGSGELLLAGSSRGRQDWAGGSEDEPEPIRTNGAAWSSHNL